MFCRLQLCNLQLAFFFLDEWGLVQHVNFSAQKSGCILVHVITTKGPP